MTNVPVMARTTPSLSSIRPVIVASVKSSGVLVRFLSQVISGEGRRAPCIQFGRLAILAVAVCQTERGDAKRLTCRKAHGIDNHVGSRKTYTALHVRGRSVRGIDSEVSRRTR